MHISITLAAVAAVAPLVAAHNEHPIPNIAGLNVRDLKTRDMLSNMRDRIAAVNQEAAEEKRDHKLSRRQGGTDGQCGAGFASCAAGYCCSPEGYCGQGSDYCYSPGCQYQYGPACPENITPAGTNTSSIPRTKIGNIEYGGNGIYECVTPGTVALTYDDGPQANFTAHILDIFASYNAKATFFITGNNIGKGEIDTTPEYVSDIQRMYAEGHQVASHTWTHLDLSAISHADRLNQMYKNEMALRNILGVIPTYMRPPYSSCTGQCETDMANLGYHVTYFNVDTDDYDQDDPNLIQNSKNWFKGNITAGGATAASSEWLSISHDIHAQTAYNLTDYMLSTLTSLGYTPVTVGECLGDPEANWYRSASGAGTTTVSTAGSTSTKTSSSAAPTGTKKVSTDATCGGTNGYTCQGSTFGTCCSVNGWCGSTTDYCGTGCQSAFGSCTGSSSSSSAKPAATSSVKTSAAATTTVKVSTDGACGGTSGKTCKGSTFGTCCSQYGYCGSTSAYCGTGCLTGFGTCT
ncbi:carbohydrate esterase family 4 protein [Lophiostoma macrostomum CBS 122681]|uniref:Carbohydrate esterase family 4 protein n=1 Tax=Lophiostoma macrostomum CBS 122681 TaxID=1314788 RepID=A0A6A6TMG6_9PLEO|nr:carbohydrate esterase family 4 protein [Lophiostoma macrostomum CBS 122681]